MLLRRAARRLRPQTRGLSAMPTSFADYAEADETMQDYAGNVRRLGRLLGERVAANQEGATVVAVVERFRHHAKKYRDAREAGHEAEAAQTFESMANEIASLAPGTLRDVARSFAHFLALSNAAEQEHRVRRLEAHRGDGAPLYPGKTDSCAGTLDYLLDEEHVDMTKIEAALASQQLEIVLTAHPTEVNRRTILSKHRRVAELLAKRPDTQGYERNEVDRELAGVVSALWGSDELRRAKPSPQQEARGGLAVVETSLWEAVPDFLRRLDATLKARGGRLPLTSAPVRLASWMGGDRDGNPNVTAPVTRETVAAQRRMAAGLLLVELDALRTDLSMKQCTAPVTQLAEESGAPSLEKLDAPYKAILDGLVGRLRATVAWADNELSSDNALKDFPKESRNSLASRFGRVAKADGVKGKAPLFDESELLEPLQAMHASLCATGFEDWAEGRLVDTIRRVGAFGLQLAPLDVRQESTRHANAIDALRAFAGVGEAGSYIAMSDDEKVAYLSQELSTNRPLLRRGQLEELVKGDFIPDAVDRDVLATALVVAEAPPNSFGAYVISQATSAADVLAVELLLAEAGAGADRPNCKRIVPLFETLDDLTNGPSSLEKLFSSEGYLERVQHRQEIMVGYSDSAKDAGRLAAWWAQYEGQEKMLAVCQQFGVEPTFFHGKGGTVGRGGNPETYRAILAHPPDTIQGRFRVTEQGEMITFNFGEPKIAERTLDIFTAAILRDHVGSSEERKVEDKWRQTMAKLSELSCAAYRKVVRETPDFVPFFRKATPELELAALNVGSRPAKRNPTGGVESLRAIPWIFAWEQTRLSLPAWLGIGEGFDGVQPEELTDMYDKWPWFRTNVDLIETTLAKTEPGIAAHYEKLLVDDASLDALGSDLRERLKSTTEAVLRVSGRNEPADDNIILQRALRLRNPYVDVLNLLQAELLQRKRTIAKLAPPGSAADDEALDDALLVTINGIAAGMQKSG